MKKFITLLFIFSISIVNAQWTTDTHVNTLVASSESGDMQALGLSTGETMIVFWKIVPAPVNYELRLQKLDADGLQQFGEDGILVSNTLPMSTFTVTFNITSDEADNLYIGVTGTEDFSAYAFKINADGLQLWGANGILLGIGVPVNILPLSSENAIVSWRDSGLAVMQQFDANGIPVWPSTKTIGSGNTQAANLFELSTGDFEVVYHSIAGGINSFLYAQRYDIDGNPQWTNPLQLADRATTFIRKYPSTQDGDIVYMGYYASAGTRFDSYLQRVNPDGSLPWGINGSDFDINETNYETETEIAKAEFSPFIWSVCTYTDNSQNMLGEYVQKFDKETGERLLSDNAKVMFAIGSDKVHAGPLKLQLDSPLFLVKEGMENGVSPTTLGSVSLDENGDFLRDNLPIATFAANKSRIQYTKQVDGQTVAVFIEDKGNGDKIYAQNLYELIAGVTDFAQNDIFYQNPISNELVLNSKVEINTVTVFNLLGQQIFRKDFKQATNISIDTQNWKYGTYFISVETTAGKFKSLKVLKN